MRFRGAGEKFVPLIVAVFLLAAGTTLGVLQVRWIGEASRADEERVRSTLARSAAEVGAQSEDEVRALLSLARVAPSDFSSSGWGQLAAALQFWHENSRFPDLLRGLYILNRPPDGRVLKYSYETGSFAVSDLTAEMNAALPPNPWAGGPPASWQSAALPDGRSLVFLPVYGSEGADRPPRTEGIVIVDVDMRILYAAIAPFFMARTLGEYPYRIVDVGSGTVLAEGGAPAAGSRPEVQVGLADPTAESSRPPKAPAAESPSFSMDPFLQPWLERSRGESQPGIVPADRGPSAPAKAMLQVYYPKGTIAGTIRAAQALNIGVSLGIIGILLASMVVLSRMYGRSVRLRASEQEFVASVSHELRTPISVIQATSENLSRGVVTEPARLPRYAEVIHGQIRRLSSIVESILLYSGLESGKARSPTLAEIDLPVLLREVVHPLEHLAEEKHSRLRLATDSLPDTICSDGTALRLIIENLVMNAISHASPGEIRLSVSRKAFDALRIMVEDDGPGIPPREHARVFEPFVRGERSVREQRPGSGLGLHLVKRVAALLDGKVTLESPYTNLAEAVRRGCRFTVVIPCREHCCET